MDPQTAERLDELNHRMLTAASEESDLVRDLDELLEETNGVEPRSDRQLFRAQRIGRRVLELGGDYGLVYSWYPAWKNPSGDTNFDPEVTHRQLLAAGAPYSWIRERAVLECGAGVAALGLVLAAQNRQWISSDVVVPEEISVLESHCEPGLGFEYRCVDGITMDGVDDGSVDVVVSRSFFEHLLFPDAEQHLRSAHRVLAPGGELVLYCPAGVGPPSDITNRFPRYDKPQGFHIEEYRCRQIHQMLRAAGFARVRHVFLRSRLVGHLPDTLRAHNHLSTPAAATLGAFASFTWRLARASAPSRWAWKLVWGHLGATAISVRATRN